MLRTTIALLAAAVLLTVPKSANTLRETSSGSERAYWKRRDLIELDAPGNEKKSGEINTESGLSQLQQPAANLPGEGDRGAREAKFLAAVKLASSSKSAGHPIVFVTVVDGNAARYHLPLFLASLKSAGRLDEHVIVATLDTWAQSVCEKVHNPELCFEEAFPASINGEDTSSVIDKHGRIDGKAILVGWMKTIVGVRVNSLGYAMALMDVDSVFFSNPLLSFDQTADIVTTNDCDDTYHPRHNRNTHTANLGFTYFSNSTRARGVLMHWMAAANLHNWDQGAFKGAMEAQVDEDPALEIQMLPRDKFSTFCCNYCDGFLDALTLHSAKWQLSCPARITQQWVMFHVACTGENRGYQGDHDEVLEKRHLMQSVYEMAMWDKQRKVFAFAIV